MRLLLIFLPGYVLKNQILVSHHLLLFFIYLFFLPIAVFRNSSVLPESCGITFHKDLVPILVALWSSRYVYLCSLCDGPYSQSSFLSLSDS